MKINLFTFYFLLMSMISFGSARHDITSIALPFPIVNTSAATLITTNSATFNGNGNPNGDPTFAWFRYSTINPGSPNDSAGNRIPVAGGIDLGSGNSSVPFSQPVTGLSSGTTYYFWAIAQNSIGTSFGAIFSFTTLSPSAPTVTTSVASMLTLTTATLNGSGNPNGDLTTGWFRYAVTNPGTCNDVFGTKAPSSGGISLGAGNSVVPYSQGISGLNASTTYYYCAIAQNSFGTSFGSIQSFVTIASANVGIGTLTPNSSAQLDVKSTTQGLLPPRMTALQRNAIGSPALGLMIYCTDCGGGEIEVYNNFGWTNLMENAPAGTLAPGDAYGGGKIAYILQSGDPGYIAGQTHGLIAAFNDNSTSLLWDCVGMLINGADGTVLGTGNQNTIDIIAGCGTPGNAARICGDLVLNGYSDWFLPSRDELNKLYLNRLAIGNFSTNGYWSSSEIDSNNAWNQNFNGGAQGSLSKAVANMVRAVRSF